MTSEFCEVTNFSRRNSCDASKGFLMELARDKPISVVVPALNEGREIGECLTSLTRQTFPPFEVIVVDNGSTDASASIARAHGAQVIHEPKRGISYAREAGFRTARAHIIASTDADTVVPPNWLERIHRTFDEDPKVIAVFGPFRHKPASASSSLANYLAPYFERGLMLGQRVTWRLGSPHFSGANFATRREAFLRVRGFHSPKDGRIYSTWEDIQLGLKLHRMGKVCYLPDLVVLTSARKLRPANAWNILIDSSKKGFLLHVMGKPL